MSSTTYAVIAVSEAASRRDHERSCYDASDGRLGPQASDKTNYGSRQLETSLAFLSCVANVCFPPSCWRVTAARHHRRRIFKNETKQYVYQTTPILPLRPRRLSNHRSPSDNLDSTQVSLDGPLVYRNPENVTVSLP